jgi:hypothetical protein
MLVTPPDHSGTEEFIQYLAGDDFHQASEDIPSQAVSPTITRILD